MASSNADNTPNGTPDAQSPQAFALPEILPSPEGGAAGISIAKVTGRTLINLRCEDEIKAKLETLFGAPLPAEPNKIASIGTRRALWLGPDETLLMIEEEQEAEFMLNLKALLGDGPLCGNTGFRCDKDFPTWRDAPARCTGKRVRTRFTSRQL
jgi:hypothetical protein